MDRSFSFNPTQTSLSNVSSVQHIPQRDDKLSFRVFFSSFPHDYGINARLIPSGQANYTAGRQIDPTCRASVPENSLNQHSHSIRYPEWRIDGSLDLQRGFELTPPG